MTAPTREDDMQLLFAIDLVERGVPHSKAAPMFGMTKGRLIGLHHRSVKAAGAIPCNCQRRENKDGGMAARWWAL